MTRSEKTAYISHPAHPKHMLQLAEANKKFKCDGCKQHGMGQSYRCGPCNYDVHTCCVPPKKALKHRLIKGCKFDFHLKPPGPKRSCDACGGKVLGFVYYNRERDIDLHPACAFYPLQIKVEGHVFKLHTDKDKALICGRCRGKGRRNDYWSYRSRDRDDNGQHMYMHLGCIMDGDGDGDGDGSSSSVPREPTDAPGQTNWYKTIWKVSKFLGKLALCAIAFDAGGIFELFEAIGEYFSN